MEQCEVREAIRHKLERIRDEPIEAIKSGSARALANNRPALRIGLGIESAHVTAGTMCCRTGKLAQLARAREMFPYLASRGESVGSNWER